MTDPTDTPPTWPTIAYDPPSGWSQAECNTAVLDMAWDAALDAQAAAANADSDATYYALISAHWTTLECWLYTACMTGVPMAQGDIGTASAWVATAVLTHYWDVRDHASDAAWDDRWATTYGTVEGMLVADLPS